MSNNIIWFDQLGRHDVETVGGKNSSLGEMINHLTKLGVAVPNGFATTASAFRSFLAENQLENAIQQTLDQLDVDDVIALAKAGKKIRQTILDADFSPSFITEIIDGYKQLSNQSDSAQNQLCAVAVRSSATAEDLPEASFAGQQETFLNITGEDEVIRAVKHVFASLYNDRAIAYRVHQGFSHADVALSAGIQLMVNADQGASGVMFTLDTESGFDDVVFITSSYGLGEPVVQGEVNPDEFYLFKPSLRENRSSIVRRSVGSKAIKMRFAEGTDLEAKVETVAVTPEEQIHFSITNDDAHQLAKYALIIEEHYGCPMDIEWAKNGLDGKLYILQARPETVTSRSDKQVIERFKLKEAGDIIATGRSIGSKIGKGTARKLTAIDQMDQLREGDVLVTDMTDPNWEPIMKRSSAIVTNRGGRTCHAAIIARELGIPAVVGCGDATETIQDNAPITVSCAEGDSGFVYSGLLDYELNQIHLEKMPELAFKIMMNVGNPERAFSFSSLPNAGVGLARLEFIINHMIGIHPKAILNYDSLECPLDKDLKEIIRTKTLSYGSPKEYYIERLKEGISSIAAAFYPKPVIVRLSDFKSNEYANLIGGPQFEPEEENPMLGFRGASRYIDKAYQDTFELECEALKRVRNEMGLTNVEVMVPFVRTLSEAKQVVELLTSNGLKRGENDLRLIMMCEIPSNALLADQFLEYFDGFSIGSNDLTQLTLGLDRDSGTIAHLFDERDPAVKALLHMAIKACRDANKYIGICGQGPSDHPDLAKWLMEEGIESVSLNPDSVVDTWIYLAKSS